MSFQVVYEFDIVAMTALLVSALAMAYTFYRTKTAIETLSLNVFISALRELSSPKTRTERRAVFRLFDNLITGKKGTMRSKKYDSIDIWIKDGDNDPISFKHDVRKLIQTNKEKFQEISVKYDRVGFMLFKLNLTKDFQKKYLDWMCISICDMWNVLAPYIYLERKYRIKFTPNFEQLAYEAFPYYNKVYHEKHKKYAKIFVLTINHKTLRARSHFRGGARMESDF